MSRDSFMERDKRKGSPSHRRSRKQETELADRFGGRRVPGSGAAFAKGDVRIKKLVLIEAKTTKHRSFSVTLDMVDKIEQAALGVGEMPALVIEFVDEFGKPIKELAVVPTYVLTHLREAE